jgi:hypothetical protein
MPRKSRNARPRPQPERRVARSWSEFLAEPSEHELELAAVTLGAAAPSVTPRVTR